MSVLIFIVVLFVLILVHEWGHFIVAKKTGMRVDEFGIGFPPKLFGIKRGETEYTLNALPIGGFVKILGENAEDIAKGSEAAPASDSFMAKSKWAQIAVLIAGVTMNVLLAWLLFIVALSIGTQTVVTEEAASDRAQLVVTNVLPESPAGRAEIPQGARITAASAGDGALIELTPSAFREFTSAHANDEITIAYHTGGETKTVTLTPETGLVEGEPERVAIGTALVLLEVVSRPLGTAIIEGTQMTLSGLRDVTLGLGGLLYDAIKMDADFSNIAGPVGIVGLVGEASSFGITSLLMFTAFISLNLAVINLLPFPALDGGRILFVIIEAIKGSPINASWVGWMNTIGFGLLILLMLAVTYNDILRLL